jgi:hypothetical protein
MNEFRIQHSVSSGEWAKTATTIIIFVRHWGVIITNSFICSVIFHHFTNGIVFQHYNDRTGGSSLIKSTTRNALYTNTNYFPVRSNASSAAPLAHRWSRSAALCGRRGGSLASSIAKLLRLCLLHDRGSVGAHARSRHTLKDSLDLGSAAGESAAPELVARVLDELDESDEQAPLQTHRKHHHQYPQNSCVSLHKSLPDEVCEQSIVPTGRE